MPTLAAISFVAPFMFAGATLICLPIIAHLVHRRARMSVVFPTIKLLVATATANASMLRLRRYLLLLLRCLAVMFLVIAFARPVWLKFGAPRPGRGVAVAVIVDTSVSTGRFEQGSTELSYLCASAARALDGLREGVDRVEIIEAGSVPRPLLSGLSPNIPAAKAAIETITGESGRADLIAAISRAGEVLAGHDGERQIVIYSDLQQSNWSELLEGADRKDLLPQGTSITIAAPRAENSDNVSISDVKVLPRNPTVGHAASVVGLVRNFSSLPQSLAVTLTVDDGAAASQSIRVEAHASAEIAFDVTFDTPQQHRLTMSIPDDRLLADNRAFAVTSAIRPPTVLLVGDDDPDEPGTATYFIRRALAPREGAGDPYVVRFLNSRALIPAQIGDPVAIVLSDIGPLSEIGAISIARYVQGGGSLVAFCGNNETPQNLASLDRAAGGAGMSPCKIGAAVESAPGSPRRSITKADWTSPMLRLFGDRSRGSLLAVQFGRIFPAESIDPTSRVILEFGANEPALSLRSIGAGAVVLAHFSPSASGSDLAMAGVFVGLLHSVLDALPSRSIEKHRLLVGESLVRSIDAPQKGVPIEALGPNGQILPSTVFHAGEFVDVSVDRVPAPGFVRITSGEKTVAWEAVNIDPRESDLKSAAPDEIRSALQTAILGAAVSEASAAQTLDLSGRPLWHLALLVVAGALAAEMILLVVWRT